MFMNRVFPSANPNIDFRSPVPKFPKAGTSSGRIGFRLRKANGAAYKKPSAYIMPISWQSFCEIVREDPYVTFSQLLDRYEAGRWIYDDEIVYLLKVATQHGMADVLCHSTIIWSDGDPMTTSEGKDGVVRLHRTKL